MDVYMKNCKCNNRCAHSYLGICIHHIQKCSERLPCNLRLDQSLTEAACLNTNLNLKPVAARWDAVDLDKHVRCG